VFRPGKHAHETGHLLQQALLARPFGAGLALGQHLVGGLDHRVEHGDDGALLIEPRAVAEGEEGFFQGRAAAFDVHLEVFDEGGFARQGLFGNGLEPLPRLGPGHAHGLSQSVALAAQDGVVSVVVQGDQVWPPEQARGEVGREHHVHRDAQRSRPMRDGPQRRGGPVECADARAHEATARVEG